jgi:hypothetical protein
MTTHTTRAASRRERVALEQQRRAALAQRRRRLVTSGSAVAAVLLVLTGLVVAKVADVGSGPGASPTAASGSAGQVVAAVTSVPASTLDEVGVGDAQAAPLPIKAPALRAGGKPQVLYVGAEYCPFCAAQRWPVVVALSRFGTFSGLGLTHSASDDVYPDTPTLSFHGSRYTSKYLAFTGVETSTNERSGSGYKPLDTLSAQDQATFTTYDRPPYVPSGSTGSIPFVDIAGAYVAAGASTDPALLEGMTQQEVAQALHDPSSPVARAVDGSANLITAALCKATGGQPGTVCQAAGVQAAAAKLPK